jgi:hypothetical protein
MKELDLLAALEKTTAELAEQQRTTPGLSALQEELRALYSARVAPVLAEIDSMESERAFYDRVSRLNLETHRAAGVPDSTYLEPIRRILAEMSSRFFAIPTSLRRIPHAIDAGPEHGEDLARFSARIKLGYEDLGIRAADGLVADIRQHHEQLVSLIQRLAEAPKRDVRWSSIEPPPPPRRPEPAVETEFPIFN